MQYWAIFFRASESRVDIASNRSATALFFKASVHRYNRPEKNMIDLHAQLIARRENDAQLVRGFVAPCSILRDGARKVLAARLRARCVAVELAMSDGLHISLRSVAERVGVSERNLHQQFHAKDALFAFPPPEFAVAVADLAEGPGRWSELAHRMRPLVRELEENVCGRNLFVGLARLHERYPALAASDAHFAYHLRLRLQESDQSANPKLLLSVGFFTDCFRFALTEWSHDSSQPLVQVLNDLPELLELQGRVRTG